MGYVRLITNRTIGNENYQKMGNLLRTFFLSSKNIYSDEVANFKKIISYTEFKIIINNFIYSIMQEFLLDTKFNCDKVNVIIDKIDNIAIGCFCHSKNNNLMIIDEDLIKEIYTDGKIENFFVIFHELNHFKTKYEIKNGVLNKNIVRILKEDLIRNTLDYNKHNNKYYQINYNLYSGEVYANIQAYKDLILFIKSISMDEIIQTKIIKRIMNLQYKRIKKEIEYYSDEKRNLTYVGDINDNYSNYDCIFDYLVSFNPQWLTYPQIGIEYYLDKDNNVLKRNVFELENLLEKSVDHETIGYINYLINKIHLKEEINTNKKKNLYASLSYIRTNL